MRKSKLIGFLLVLLVVCMICTSCNIGSASGTTGTTKSDNDVTTTPDSTTTNKPTTTPPPVTTTPTPEPDPEPGNMPNDEELLLGGVNITSYTIVYGRSQMEKTYNSKSGNTAWDDLMNGGIENYENMLQGENKEADFDYETAVRLQELIKEKFGYKVNVVKDSDATTVSPYEILVGYTDRTATITISETLKIDQYYCGFNTADETLLSRQFVICGGSYGATWHAIDAIEAYLEDPSLYVPKVEEEEGEEDGDEAVVIDLSDVPNEDESEPAVDDDESAGNEPSPTALNVPSNMNYLGAYDFKAVATIGDSITRGSQGFPDANGYGDDSGFAKKVAGSATSTYLEQFLSWPAVLQRELWKDYLICNYGQGYSTMIDFKKDEYPDPGPYYYNDTAKFTALLTESNREDFEFDVVLIMLGTNDAGQGGGASNWSDGVEDEYIQETQSLMRKILVGSPNATFVMMNAPHRCDGNSTTEAKDAAIRELQKRTAKELIEEYGYDIYLYDMESYTVENLVGEGMTCAEKSENAAEMSDADILELEKDVHGDYYNIKTDTGTADTTHPNYRGYGKIAEGMVDLLEYLFDGAEAPAYMLDPFAVEVEEEPAA